jgi:peptide-methionine (S)-S-oxide reductase
LGEASVPRRLEGPSRVAGSRRAIVVAVCPPARVMKEAVMALFGAIGKKLEVPAPGEALPGREERMPIAPAHFVTGAPLEEAFEGAERILVAMGCFWGAERKFWESEGVISTSVGYVAGQTPNPTYQEVCSGRTGHTEAVRVIFDPARTSYEEMLRVFWENHDPTQGMRQGNDVGTQYRSGLYYYDDRQKDLALASRDAFQERLRSAGYGPITTEVQSAPEFFFAEDYHQQYLAKNPGGYCGLGGTGVSCPVGLVAGEASA